MHIRTIPALLLVALFGSVQLIAQPATATVQPTTAETAATRDTSYIDAQGTAHITRVVPIPDDLSPEAKKSLIRIAPDQGPPEQVPAMRARQDARQTSMKAAWTALCPNTIEETEIADI